MVTFHETILYIESHIAFLKAPYQIVFESYYDYDQEGKEVLFNNICHLQKEELKLDGYNFLNDYQDNLEKNYYTLKSKMIALRLHNEINNLEGLKTFYNEYIEKFRELLDLVFDFNGSKLKNSDSFRITEERYFVYGTPDYRELENRLIIDINMLKETQYSCVFGEVQNLISEEYNHIQWIIKSLEAAYKRVIFNPNPLCFNGSSIKLRRIASMLNELDFISENSVQPFIDYFMGENPIEKVEWLQATSSFSVFINRFLKCLKKPKGNKTWAYFENNPVFIDKHGKHFSRLRNSFDGVTENYDKKQDLEKVFRLL